VSPLFKNASLYGSEYSLQMRTAPSDMKAADTPGSDHNLVEYGNTGEVMAFFGSWSHCRCCRGVCDVSNGVSQNQESIWWSGSFELAFQDLNVTLILYLARKTMGNCQNYSQDEGDCWLLLGRTCSDHRQCHKGM
jgi:hypothetical protein